MANASDTYTGAVLKGKQYTFERVPYQIVWQEESKIKETYAGRNNYVIIDGFHHKPDATAPKSDAVLIFMHPAGITTNLAICHALPKMGIPVLCAVARYPKNDTALIMEKVAVDLGQHVKYAREVLGYKYVILAGWSGGGSLSMFYQSEAEKPEITHTPAGDVYSLVDAKLPPADGVIQVATHVSRAHIMTEMMDVSFKDETKPDERDPSLDLFGGQVKPPYGQEFFQKIRKLQIERNKRIDDYVFNMLDFLKKSPRGELERGFMVHGTRSDPTLFDTSLDPNDRAVEELNALGNPAEVNMGPSGLARYSCLRSWLSQWSYVHSRVHSPTNAKKVSVPILVVENTADDICMASHPQRIWAAVKDKKDAEYKQIKGATHYYFDQPEKLQESATNFMVWMRKHNWINF